MRSIFIYPNEKGLFTAVVPSLPNCIAHGGTFLDALSNIQDELGIYLHVLESRGETPPPDTTTLDNYVTEVIPANLIPGLRVFAPLLYPPGSGDAAQQWAEDKLRELKLIDHDTPHRR